MLRTTLLASLVLLATPAFAIYKCEKNGAITYSDEACAAPAFVSTQHQAMPARRNDAPPMTKSN
jgi:hypothetical protein